MVDKLQLLTEGFGLNKASRKLLIRAGWVLMVSGSLAWFLGFWAFLGITSPFASANEMDKKITAAIAPVVEQQKADTKSIENISTMLKESLLQSKASQIRAQLSIICTKHGDERERAQTEKERLQGEYSRVNDNGPRYTEPPCEQLR